MPSLLFLLKKELYICLQLLAPKVALFLCVISLMMPSCTPLRSSLASINSTVSSLWLGWRLETPWNLSFNLFVFVFFCSHVMLLLCSWFPAHKCVCVDPHSHMNMGFSELLMLNCSKSFSVRGLWCSGFLMDFWSVLQVSKPSQEAYQNELNIESVERSFILSARSAHSVPFYTSWAENKYSLRVCSEFWCVLCSQLGYRERRVAGGHRQGHRRLHKEENNLHIKSESGGGKTINPCSCVFEHKILLNASMVTFSPSRFRRSALSTAGPR